MSKLKTSTVNTSTPDQPASWSVSDSEDLDGVKDWGTGYFNICDNGELEVTVQGPDAQNANTSKTAVSGIINSSGVTFIVNIGRLLT